MNSPNIFKKKIHITWILCAIFLSIPIPIGAKACVSAREDSLIYAFVFKRDTLAFKELVAYAKNGSTESQNVIGMAYLRGEDVGKDEESGLFWIRKAASQEDASAQLNLATFYKNGTYLEKDTVQYAVWIEKAVKQGYPPALWERGKYHSSIFRENHHEAVKFFQQAIDSGYTGPIPELAICYQVGQGLPKDLVKAHMWFSIAEHFKAEKSRAQRIPLERKLTEKQIKLSRRLSTEWLRKHKPWRHHEICPSR
jgi:uncharacterized protein